jgi:hypothetical protein
MYIATFYSHFGAIRFKRLCEAKAWSARVMPVPRSLSSSCGTCVRYKAANDACAVPNPLPEEVEQIVRVCDDGSGYEPLHRAENS